MSLLYDVTLHYDIMTLQYNVIKLWCHYNLTSCMTAFCFIMMSLHYDNIIMLHYDVNVLCYYFITLC